MGLKKVNGLYSFDATVTAKAAPGCDLSLDYLGQTGTGTTPIPSRPAAQIDTSGLGASVLVPLSYDIIWK
ncbi:MAG: hypothetical protein H7319_19350 [Spirosoma sp.]|nr:hypothetical protein [Spirosoma sp.]